MAEKKSAFTPFGKSAISQSHNDKPCPQKAVSRPVQTTTGGEESVAWQVGDKAQHKKWGIGTVVSVKGTGEGIELDIAFPSPMGVKRLLAKFAPIEKA